MACGYTVVPFTQTVDRADLEAQIVPGGQRCKQVILTLPSKMTEIYGETCSVDETVLMAIIASAIAPALRDYYKPLGAQQKVRSSLPGTVVRL